MPITLITGLPGHGKTLYTLARYKDEAEKAGRPVYHNDIKGLMIPGWSPWKPEEWQELPPNSLMIIDECQFVFPQRGRGQPPEWIERLATHRHLGLDFVIITQNPMLIDSFVRRLVDRHFHVVRKFGTHFATIHEFVNGVKDNVDKSREGSIRHEWRYPKEVFDWYKSAEVHTVKKRLPARVYLLFSIPFILIVFVWIAYTRLNPQSMQNRVNASSGQNDSINKPNSNTNNSHSNPNKTQSTSEYLASYIPRVPDFPHTAPIYDNITTPVTAPYPAGCIASKNRCHCYSQQGTVLDISASTCRQITQKGFFVAWSLDSKGQRSDARSSSPPSSSTSSQVVARADPQTVPNR